MSFWRPYPVSSAARTPHAGARTNRTEVIAAFIAHHTLAIAESSKVRTPSFPRRPHAFVAAEARAVLGTYSDPGQHRASTVRSRIASGRRRVSRACTPIPHPTLVVSDASEARLLDEEEEDDDFMARTSSYVRPPLLLSEACPSDACGCTEHPAAPRLLSQTHD
jgi:hypothetical protein